MSWETTDNYITRLCVSGNRRVPPPTGRLWGWLHCVLKSKNSFVTCSRGLQKNLTHQKYSLVCLIFPYISTNHYHKSNTGNGHYENKWYYPGTWPISCSKCYMLKQQIYTTISNPGHLSIGSQYQFPVNNT